MSLADELLADLEEEEDVEVSEVASEAAGGIQDGNTSEGHSLCGTVPMEEGMHQSATRGV